jgi:hypothetical protein
MDLDESHEGGSITSSSGINFSECALKEPPVALAVADAWRAMKPHFEETRRAANYTPAELAAATAAAAAASASATTATAGTTSRLGFGSGLATSVVPAAATVAAVELAPQDDAKAVKQQLREDVARSLSPLRDSHRNATSATAAAVHSNGSNGNSDSRSRDRDSGGDHNGQQRSHSRSSNRRYDEQHQQHTPADRHIGMHAGDHHYSGEQYDDSRYRSEGAYNAAYDEREISGRKHGRNSDERREAVYYDDHAVHDDMHSDSHYGHSSDRHYADYNSNDKHYEHSAYEHNSVHSSGSKSSKRRHRHSDSRSDRYADDHHHHQQQQLSREAMLAADAAKRAAEAQYDEDVRRARLARQEQQRLRESGKSRQLAYSPLNDNGGVSSHTARGRSRSHESSRHSGSSSKRKRHGHKERSSERSREVVGVVSSWGNGNGDHHNSSSSYDVYNGGYDESGRYNAVDTLQQQQQQQQYYEQEGSRHSHSSSSKRSRSRSRDRSGHRTSSSRRRSSEHKHKHSSSSSGSVLQDAAAVATANAIAIAQMLSAKYAVEAASAANASVSTTAGDTTAGSSYAPAAPVTTITAKPEVKCAQDATSATEFLAAIQAQKAASKTSAATSSSNSRVTPPKVPQFDSSTNSLAASSTRLLQQPPVFSSATNTLDSKSLSVNTSSFTTGVTGATDRWGPGSSGSEGDSPTK